MIWQKRQTTATSFVLLSKKEKCYYQYYIGSLLFLHLFIICMTAWAKNAKIMLAQSVMFHCVIITNKTVE